MCISSSTGVSYTQSIDWCFQTFIDTTAALQACASYDGCLNNWCPRNFPNNNPIMAAVKTNDNCSQTTPEKAKQVLQTTFTFWQMPKTFGNQCQMSVCMLVTSQNLINGKKFLTCDHRLDMSCSNLIRCNFFFTFLSDKSFKNWTVCSRAPHTQSKSNVH